MCAVENRKGGRLCFREVSILRRADDGVCAARLAWRWGRHRCRLRAVEALSRPPAAGRMRQRPLAEQRPAGRRPRAAFLCICKS